MINELIDESLAMSGERRCLHFSSGCQNLDGLLQ
ncbi:putative prophage protein [Escherichia coli]|nr:putative prophage protein [Escherichia coli]